MNSSRHGRRLPCIAFAFALALAGCGAPASPEIVRDSLNHNPSSATIADHSSAVIEIVWGRDDASGSLGIRLADGRFAIHRPEHGPSPARVYSIADEPPATTLAILSANRVATGSAEGLTLWDTSADPSRVVSRLACGAISAMVEVKSDVGERLLVVGRDDGNVFRCRWLADRFERFADPTGSGPRVLKIIAVPGSSEIVILRDDGTATRMRGDLVGLPRPLGEAVDLAFGSNEQTLTRVSARGEMEIEPAPIRRISLPKTCASVAFADRGRVLVIGMDGECWLQPILLRKPVNPLAAIRVTGLSGRAIVALDPSDPEEKRIAVGDASGRVERVNLGDWVARASRISLDDVPELAYQPARRFGRSREEIGTTREPKGEIDRRLAFARNAIENGDVASVASLETEASLDVNASAEVRALIAVAENQGHGTSPAAVSHIESARAAFARGGQTDREADFTFWLGLLRTRPFDDAAAARTPRSSVEALPLLRRASHLYRSASPPLVRQAILAEATIAWVLLDLGDRAAAEEAFAIVEIEAKKDHVLAQVVELDRIAGAIAMARADFLRADAAHAKILARLRPDERPSLARRAAIGRALALSHLGRNQDAATILALDKPNDAEWSIRRAACQIAAGRTVRPPRNATDDDAIAAHIRALIALASPAHPSADLVRDLETASNGHRIAGRADLALETELALAESLERSGRVTESIDRYLAVSQAIRELPDRDDVHQGERPILSLEARALRGAARGEIVSQKFGSAIATLASPPSNLSGSLGLNAEEFAKAEHLFRKRETLRAGGPAENAATLETEINRLETLLAGRKKTHTSIDASANLDLSRLEIPENQAILAFSKIGPESVAGIFIGSGEKVAAIRLPISWTELVALISAWRAKLGDGGRPMALVSPVNFDAFTGLGTEPDLPAAPSVPSSGGSLEARLNDALIAPFESHFSGVTRLDIVPSDALGGLPIGLMGRERRLVDRFVVAYLPGVGFFHPLQQADDRPAPSSSDRILFLSPTEELEVRFWAQACRVSKWRPQALVGNTAARDRMFALSLGNYHVIHIASPTSVDARSGLVAFDLPGERLTMSDLAGQPLRAGAVVFQAGGYGIPGEAIINLGRAGLLTGTRSVVVTLWEPPKLSARRFYAEFYARLQQGDAPAAAVETARAAVARISEFRDPVHWAGYVLYGR